MEENGVGGLNEKHRPLPFMSNSFAFSCPETVTRVRNVRTMVATCFPPVPSSAWLPGNRSRLSSRESPTAYSTSLLCNGAYFHFLKTLPFLKLCFLLPFWLDLTSCSLWLLPCPPSNTDVLSFSLFLSTFSLWVITSISMPSNDH